MNLVKAKIVDGAKQLARVLYAVLREIFDESAYERFLVAHGLKSSRGAYSLYLRETASVRERRPRCC